MSKKMYTLFVLPACIILAVVLFIPLLSLILPTFVQGNGFMSKYIELFTDTFFLSVLWRTVKIGAIVTLISIVVGVPVAFYISRQSQKVRSLLITLCMFPLLTNSIIRAFAWTTILGKNGFINAALLKLGIIQDPLALLYSEFAIIIGTVYLFLPLMITTLVGVMEQINDDLLEASQALGNNGVQTFFAVVLPLSMPGISVGSMLVFTGAITAYTTPFLLGGNKNMVLATFLSQEALQKRAWDNASAIAFIMIVLTLIVMKMFSMLSKRLDKRGNQ